MSDEELIHDFASKVSRGEITFDKVRPQLEQQGMDEVRIRQIVRRVDDEVQAALVTQSKSSSVDGVIRLGIMLIVIGGVVAIGSVAGLFSTANSVLVFAYGPIVAGVVLLVSGMRRKKRILSGTDTSHRTFRVREKRKND